MDDVEAVLPVLPSLAAVVVVVLVVGLLVSPPARLPGAGVTARSCTDRPLAAVGGLVVLVVLAAVARFGPAAELDNPVPALVVGLGPPLLVVVPAAVGLVARRRSGGAAAVDPSGAWWGVPTVLVVAAYLAVVPGRAEPARLGAALAAYAVVGLAIAVALGRGALARTEPVGLLASWAGLGPRLVRWSPPAGAVAVLSVVLGAAWCEWWTRSEAWRSAVPSPEDAWLLLAGCLVAAGAVGWLLQRWGGAVAAAALVPLAGGAVVAGGLRRLLISGQLLLQQAGARDVVDADPLGVTGGQLAAAVVVAVAGSLAAAVVARRSGEGPARLPALSLVLVVTALSSVVVLQP